MAGDDSIDDRTFREARYTLDHYVKRIKNQDRKAVGIFRLNFLVLGILLSSLTIVLNLGGIPVDPFFNLWSIAGTLLLFGSTFVSAGIYASSSYEVGINPQFIERVESGSYDTGEEFNSALVDLYSVWIRHNRSVGDFNVYLVTISILSVFDGIVFLLGATVVGVTGYDGTWMSYTLFFLSFISMLVIDAVIWKADRLYVRFEAGR